MKVSSAELRLFVVLPNGRLHGANRVALGFLQALQKEGATLDIYLLDGKECSPEFRSLGTTLTLRPYLYRNASGISQRWHASRFRRRWSSGHWHAVYANTAHVAEFLAGMPEVSPPILWHLHDLAFIVQTYTQYEKFLAVVPRVARFIPVSDGVRADLECLGVPAEKMRVVPPIRLDVPMRADTEMFESMGIPREAVVIGGCGEASWRKGTDLFIVIAREVLSARPEAHFVWFGTGVGEDCSWLMSQFRYDAEQAGFGDRIHFPGQVEDAGGLSGRFSVLALPSRVDCWPLVMLEAAAAGVPTVCFQAAGGAEEFVRDGAGTAVPYLDTAAFASAILRYLDDREAWNAASAAGLASRESYTADRIVPALRTELDRMLSETKPVRE